MKAIRVRYGASEDQTVTTDDLTATTASFVVGQEGEIPVFTKTAALYKNGTVISWGNDSRAGTSNTTSSVGSDLLQLTATDYIELWSYSSATTAMVVGVGGKTRLSGYLVSAT